MNGEYEMRVFQGSDRILSATFPELVLTVDQIVAASHPRKRRS